MSNAQDNNDYPYYNGDRDPRLYEPESQEDVELFDHVECSNGCGYWAGQLINDGMCPECGSECNDVSETHFDED